MLLRFKNTIINTDQIIKAEYVFKSYTDSHLAIFMVDSGHRSPPPHPLGMVRDNVIRFSGLEAGIVWSALSQEAQIVTVKKPDAPKA